jgi:hypothetical protein
MMSEKIIECENKRLNKIANFRLPNYFKKIGIGIFILSFLGIMSKLIITGDSELINEISKKGFLIGMLLISISKEKIEDEFTIKLRAQSYSMAFVIGVIYALLMPYVEYGVSNAVHSGGEVFKDLGDFQVLTFMLLIQLMFYYTLKKAS